jgi:hypothetical protein
MNELIAVSVETAKHYSVFSVVNAVSCGIAKNV